MEQDQDVLDSLMTGLTDRDRTGLQDAIRSAQADQLDRKKHPPRRRRRDANGVLVDLPPGVGDGMDADELGDDEFDEDGVVADEVGEPA